MTKFSLYKVTKGIFYNTAKLRTYSKIKMTQHNAGNVAISQL